MGPPRRRQTEYDEEMVSEEGQSAALFVITRVETVPGRGHVLWGALEHGTLNHMDTLVIHADSGDIRRVLHAHWPEGETTLTAPAEGGLLLRPPSSGEVLVQYETWAGGPVSGTVVSGPSPS